MGRGFRIYSNLEEQVFKALRDIKQYDEKTQADIRNAVRDGTKGVMEESIRRAPMKTGKLKSNITMSFDYDKSMGIVRAKSPHAHLVEYGARAAVAVPDRKKALTIGDGFAASANIPARPAHPFMRPAIEKERPEIEKKIREVLK